MIQNVCFDIETRGTTNQAVIDQIRADESRRECPGKPTSSRPRKETKEKYLVAAEDWEKSLESRIQERIDATAKNCLLAEPVCISSMFDGEISSFHCLGGATESQMIREYLMYIAQNCDDQAVFSGYCIKVFDLPVLITRARILDIDIPSIFPYMRGRYWSNNTLDIQDLIFSNKPFLSFNEAAMSYGIQSKRVDWRGQPMTGARIQDALRAGEHDLIIEYCEADAEDEWALLNKCVSGHTVPTWTDLIGDIVNSDLSDAQKVIAIRNLI